jgi:hypothetical protein
VAGRSSRARGPVPGAGDQGDEPGPEYVDEHHAAIAQFAADYLDEDERDKFVNHLMERRGYRRIESWGPPDDAGGDDGQDLDDGGDVDDGQDLDDGRGRRQPARTTGPGTGRRRPQYFKR